MAHSDQLLCTLRETKCQQSVCNQFCWLSLVMWSCSGGKGGPKPTLSTFSGLVCGGGGMMVNLLSRTSLLGFAARFRAARNDVDRVDKVMHYDRDENSGCGRKGSWARLMHSDLSVAWTLCGVCSQSSKFRRSTTSTGLLELHSTPLLATLSLTPPATNHDSQLQTALLPSSIVRANHVNKGRIPLCCSLIRLALTFIPSCDIRS